MYNASVQAAVAALCEHWRLDGSAWSQAGRLVLEVDHYSRLVLVLQHSGGNRLAIEVLCAILPAVGSARDVMLERILRQVSAPSSGFPGTVALARDGLQLLLQADWYSESEVRLEVLLELLLSRADRCVAAVEGQV